MNIAQDHKETALRYFLGKLTPEEESDYEALYFTDAAVLEQLQIVQDELIEDYLGDDLSATDRELFDTKFLASPTHRKKLAVTKALRQAASTAATEGETAAATPAHLSSVSRIEPPFKDLRRNPRRWLAAAAVLLIVVLGFLLLRGFFIPVPPEKIANANANLHPGNANQPRPDFAQQNANIDNRNEAPLPQNNPDKRAPDGAPHIAVFLLSAATKSSLDEKPLVIESRVKTIRLQIALATDDYHSYQATIKTLNGEVIFFQNGMKPTRWKSGGVITLDIAAKNFTSQSYSVLLEGMSTQRKAVETDKYFFRVEKK